jgi:putative ABC transport system substrate-binding protein
LAILANVDNPVALLDMRQVEATASNLALPVVTLEIRRSKDIAPAFAVLKDRPDALYVATDPLVLTNRVRINTLALGAHLPTMYGSREYVDVGGLSCSDVPPIMSTRFCAGQSRATSRLSSQPSSIS